MNNKIPIIFNPKLKNNACYITDDSVMGGLSKGNFELINEVMIFSGDISKDNNGGFTSIFQPITNLSSNIDTIKIRIVGDGNRYQLRVKTNVIEDIPGYKVEFLTKKNIIETHSFKLSDFQASIKGQIISNAPELTPFAISHVGFLINSKVAKNFILSIYLVEFSQSHH